MSRPKKPTRTQKIFIAESGYNWKNWNVLAEDDKTLTLVNKITGNKRRLLK